MSGSICATIVEEIDRVTDESKEIYDQAAFIDSFGDNIWPFGHGMIVTGLSKLFDGSGAMFIMGVPDGYGKNDCGDASIAFDAACTIGGGPRTAFLFNDLDSVDMLIGQLERLKEKMISEDGQ